MTIQVRNTNYSDTIRLIERYPKLAKFGYHDEELVMEWGRGYEAKVVINSPEDFISLVETIDREIIISAVPGCTPYIEIYDGWRE